MSFSVLYSTSTLVIPSPQLFLYRISLLQHNFILPPPHTRNLISFLRHCSHWFWKLGYIFPSSISFSDFLKHFYMPPLFPPKFLVLLQCIFFPESMCYCPTKSVSCKSTISSACSPSIIIRVPQYNFNIRPVCKNISIGITFKV